MVMALLKLESWKLFLLMLTPALLGASALLLRNSVEVHRSLLLVIGQIGALLFVCVFVYWIYQLGAYLVHLPPNQNYSLAVFTVPLGFATLYRVAIDAYGLWYGLKYQAAINLETILWIVPLHLLATLAALYCFYTDARMLVSAERKQSSGFKAVWPTFGLILIFPIGIWFIQPRVQKLFSHQE